MIKLVFDKEPFEKLKIAIRQTYLQSFVGLCRQGGKGFSLLQLVRQLKLPGCFARLYVRPGLSESCQSHYPEGFPKKGVLDLSMRDCRTYAEPKDHLELDQCEAPKKFSVLAKCKVVFLTIAFRIRFCLFGLSTPSIHLASRRSAKTYLQWIEFWFRKFSSGLDLRTDDFRMSELPKDCRLKNRWQESMKACEQGSGFCLRASESPPDLSCHAWRQSSASMYSFYLLSTRIFSPVGLVSFCKRLTLENRLSIIW